MCQICSNGGMETWKWKRCDRKKEGHKEEGKTRQENKVLKSFFKLKICTDSA